MAEREDGAANVLVIGYGNPLRGDDGLGPHIADAVAALGLPGVQVLKPLQLVPELAADLATARLAVFVDARAGAGGLGVEAMPITPGKAPDWTTHAADPRALLALTQALYGWTPDAWWVTVPGVAFGPGEGLSQAARASARDAVERVASILRGFHLPS